MFVVRLSLPHMKIPRDIWGFLAVWAVINLVQAAVTGLLHDEAYYWVFSQHLSGGYFDHPPGIAAMIAAGYALVGGSLGVRLSVVLANVLTLGWLWHLIGGRDAKLYALLIASMLLVHAGGFIAVPDIPLVLFSTAFFALLKLYLKEDDWRTAAGLGLIIALLGYSKYHGILVVFFSFIPNWRLIYRKSFWIIPLLAAVVYAPHLYWQYAHQFPTFRYHLQDRFRVPYYWGFFTDYLLGQLLVYGPFMSFLVFPAAVRMRTRDAFERTMKWCFYGFFGFFLYTSFRRSVEANWTAMAVIPLVYLAYHYIAESALLQKRVKQWAVPSLLVALLFRVLLVWDFLPPGWNPRNETHGWKDWAGRVATLAGDRPVVFVNSYQFPSKYMFYSGRWAHSLNEVHSAGNQFDLWPEREAAIQGREVLVLWDELKVTDSLEFANAKSRRYQIMPNFRSYNRIKIDIPESEYRLAPGATKEILITMYNPTGLPVDFQADTQPLTLRYCLFRYDKTIILEDVLAPLPVKRLEPGQSVTLPVTIRAPTEKGDTYRFRLAIQNAWIAGRNSNFVRLVVK